MTLYFYILSWLSVRTWKGKPSQCFHTYITDDRERLVHRFALLRDSKPEAVLLYSYQRIDDTERLTKLPIEDFLQ